MSKSFCLSKEHGIYFILLAAFLNAVLRLSPESNVTMFRLLIPAAVLLIGSCSQTLFKQLVAVLALLGAVQLVQHDLTAALFFPNLRVSIVFFLEYYFHYSCIVLVLFLILCLKQLQGEAFFEKSVVFLSLFVKAMAVFILIYTVLLGNNLMNVRTADNINNIGCMMTAGMCLLLVRAGKDKKQALWCLLILFLLYHNDSKAALFGALAAAFLCLMLAFSNKAPRGRIVLRRVFIALVLCMVAYLLYRSPMINGYSLSQITIDPVRRILHNEAFETADTSVTYRTNSTLAAFEILKRTGGIGVGIGNTGRALKDIMTNVYEKWAESASYSLHNWWLELMCDFGWPMILGEIFFFARALLALLYSNIRSEQRTLETVFLLSFPIWSISASGLTTEYYSLAVLAFVLIVSLSGQTSCMKDEEMSLCIPL